jgi:hypothetical protein
MSKLALYCELLLLIRYYDHRQALTQPRLFKKKIQEPKNKRSTMNSRSAQQDLDFIKIIEESKMLAQASQKKSTSPVLHSSVDSDQENIPYSKPKPIKKSPKKKKKPLKFIDLHRRVKIMIDYLESQPELMIDEPENDLVWEDEGGFIPTGAIDLFAGQVHSALIRFQQRWDQY